MPPLRPNEKRDLRAFIAEYCEIAEAHEERFHYSQARPFSYGAPNPSRRVNLDCSGYVGRVYKWAAGKADVKVDDPLGGNWKGFGWTGSIEHFMRGYGGTVTTQGYLVGDVALFGPEGHAHTGDSHTIICRAAGSASTSVWSSNGAEAGPVSCRLTDRRKHPLIGVWRHPALL